MLHAAVKVYAAAGAAVFSVELPGGASNTNASNPALAAPPQKPGPAGLAWQRTHAGAFPPSISFPGFAIGPGSDSALAGLRWATWQSVMCPILVGESNVTAAFAGLATSGPVVLFDDTHASVVVSPLDNFKSAVHTATGTAWETGSALRSRRSRAGSGTAPSLQSARRGQ